jgi:uncharacterized radical SAM protein YgiQ
MAQAIPMSLAEAKKRGWDSFDVILISGDAFIDHSAFGTAVIARVLESKGFKVGVIAQPDWKKIDDFKKLGKPNLFFGVSAGNMDSMTANYTPMKRSREKDWYSPKGKPGLRPDLASIVYAHKLREAFPGSPIILGGTEATLRRFAHYDYSSNKIRKSILSDAKAHALIHGTAEKTIVEIAQALQAGKTLEDVHHLKGLAYIANEIPKGGLELPSFNVVSNDKKKFASTFKEISLHSNPFSGKPLAQKHLDKYIVSNPICDPLTEKELDEIYELPYTRKSHPSYGEEIPALQVVINSVQVARGCFGQCSFCSIPLTQGKTIQSRSIESIKREVEIISKLPGFKGTINDLSAPSANMYGLKCKARVCTNSCLGEKPCPNLDFNDEKLLKLYREVRMMKGVKHVRVQSGIRLDLALHQPDFLRAVMQHHVGGQLKVAPEHVSEKVTRLMRKSSKKSYFEFIKLFKKLKQKMKKDVFIVPYFIAGHPGCGLNEMAELMDFMIEEKQFIEQGQLFTPNPLTAATAMYWSGYDPFTNEKIFVPYTFNERKMQNAMLHFKDPNFKPKVLEALKKIRRIDLIKKAYPLGGKPSAPANKKSFRANKKSFRKKRR